MKYLYKKYIVFCNMEKTLFGPQCIQFNLILFPISKINARYFFIIGFQYVNDLLYIDSMHHMDPS